MAGRPPGLPLDPEDPGRAPAEVRQIDTRFRLALPQRFLKRLDWFRLGEPHEVLLDLSRSGMMVVRSWDEWRDGVLRGRSELVRETGSDPSA